MKKKRNGKIVRGINFQLSLVKPERDAEIERKRTREKAKAIFERWMHEFVNKPKLPEEVKDSFNQLAAELDREIRDKEFVNQILDTLIYPCIQRSHELEQMLAGITIKVEGKCDGCASRNRAEVNFRAWRTKKFDLLCECGDRIPGNLCQRVISPMPRAQKKKRL